MRWPWQKDTDAEYRAGLANPSGWLLESLGSTGTYSGEAVTVKKMLTEAAVYSAMRMISEKIGEMPLKVYRILDDDERIEAREHRSWRLLHDSPNPNSTAHAFWATTAVHLLAYENAFIYKERPDPFSDVESLWHLDPEAVTIQYAAGRQKRYVVEGPPKRVYRPEEVIHIPGFSLDGIMGAPRTELCRQTLGTALARSKFEGGFYQRGARIPGVIEHPGRLGEQGVKNLAESFGRWHGGNDNMHKVPVLEEGATFKPVAMNMQEMQFVELRQQTLTEIAVMFQLPPSYLGASTGDSLTYATTESNQIQFATMAISPLSNRIAKAISADAELLPWNVMFAEFTLEALFRADMKTRAEYWKAMKDMGVVDEQYIAARENLPKPPKKPPAPPVPVNGAPTVPPAMAAMQDALKNTSG